MTTEFTAPRPGDPCPCGTGKTLAACCWPIIRQERKPATAEELMRSRFTAHVARDWAHLHRTYLETSKEPYVAKGDEMAQNWTRLVIHAHEPGIRPDTAYVDFTAYYKEGDAEKSLQERAEFRRDEGSWIYVRPVRQGPAPIKSQAKVGRNDPCPCGSGKKHKQCCLQKA